MTDANWTDESLDDAGPMLPRRKLVDRDELDITPMIDITFLLLIYFLVCSVPDANTAIELPEARFGKGVGQANSVVLTVTDGGLGAAPVYLADGRVEKNRLSDNLEKQSDQIQAAVEQGMSEGKGDVIIKAARGVAYREVARVVAAVSRVEGVRLHVGVLEVE